MAQTEEKRTVPAQIQALETRIGRQVFQLKGLMSVTQAINENVGAEALFEMLGRFLSFEMQIGRFTLLFREANKWKIVSSHQADLSGFDSEDISPLLAHYGAGARKINDTDASPFTRQFEYGLQVMHKSTPLASLFMADFRQEDDVVGQLDFVTAVTNVVAMAIENKRLFKEQLQQKLLNREVEVAAEIQKALIPRSLPSGSRYEMSSIYRPHFAVGGDYYDVIEFPDGKVTFCIADITGKGVSAALLMANFQANFHAIVPRCATLEEVVTEMNAAVHRVTEGDRFITLFIAQYDASSRQLQYINAGHTPPILFIGGEVQRLRSGTTVLGWLPELPFLETGSVQLDENAWIFTYTDGLTDVCNQEGKDFNDDLLIEFLLAHRQYPVRDINKQLLEFVETFKGDEPYPDDITVLSCRLMAG